ncbi:deoxyribose-phosphate aldolase [Aquimarina sp. AD1]|uniref:DUF6503 family protein n=1 Tax=Aquimarina sp. (strain AD1) TaxID=1714848 RepID=UPI000E4DC78B|nr:DUF6503 family protein [Aquimarina sp. AD1]AXT54811.1 deoxyribose-phosphate aldolase [Aquimarina sp. AD1]RKN20398.1 deoxyribose-phosphate aldolase [Aquimarina sp. AD1]
MKKFSFLCGILFLLSFTTPTIQYNAQQIVDKAIENAGGAKFDNVMIRFSFRGKEYRSARSNGQYQLERVLFSNDGMTHDILSNKGLSRTIESCKVKVVDSMVTKISDGVNSVHYFANLPYGLNAPAVHKKLVGESKLKGSAYYKIKVTFDQEGGGTDYEDEFMYWIHKENFTIDYLAYKYAVDGGGIRFREAYNARVVNGIRFVDYNNYKAGNLSTPLSELDSMFDKDKLKLLSKIELDDIYVYDDNDCC